MSRLILQVNQGESDFRRLQVCLEYVNYKIRESTSHVLSIVVNIIALYQALVTFSSVLREQLKITSVV